MAGLRELLMVTSLAGLIASCGDSSPSEPMPNPPVVTPPPVDTTTPPPTPTPQQGDIRMDASVRYQTITGWEAHAQAGQDDAPYNSYRDNLLDRAVNELGINRIRIEPRASFEHSQDLWSQYQSGQLTRTQYRCVWFSTVNDNDDPRSINWNGFHFAGLDHYIDDVVLPLRQRLAARGESLYVVATYVAFVNHNCAGTSYHHDDSPEEYAEFVLATYLHMQQKYGFVPDAWEVILEPDNTPFWRGTQIGQAIVAAAARLQENGFTPRFIAPSTTRPSNASPYFDDIASVSGATSHMTELAYHRYGTASDDLLLGLATRAAQHGLNTSMLEHIGSGHEDLHKDLKLANVSAWQQFALAFPTTDNGAQYYTISTSGSTATVQMGSRSKFLAQYFRYIRRGAVRIQAQTTRADLDPLAFINPGNKWTVVVKTTGQSTFTVGVPAGTYGITSTTLASNNVAQPDVVVREGELLTASIPLAGVVTIYRK